MRVVSRKAIVVAVLSAIAIAASGCSGDSDAEAESPPATTTEQAETPTVDISKFRAAFKETFGTPPDERPWYGLITGMKIAPREIVTVASSYRVLEITTNESPSDTVVSEICEAVFALDSETRIGIEAVRVIGPDGGDGGCA